MTLKRFFAYSIAIHTFIIITALSLTPAVKRNKGEEFFARLVSSEELFSPRSTGSHAPTPMIGVGHGYKVVERGSPEETRKFEIKPSPAMPAITDVRSLPYVRPGVIIPSQEGNLPVLPEKRGAYPSPPPSIREKLFDKSIIGDLAKGELEKEENEKKERTLTFDTKEYKFLIYNKILKERIESIWIYPPDAVAQGIYGDLIIKFTIKKNGRLGAVELIRTSGHKNLDDAALKALMNAEPFWPLPDEWGMEAYTIEGHFVYTIYGYYIR
ncbi:MAG: TonB family protein [Nitrospirota bacterium]